jgi:hypothetical protein
LAAATAYRYRLRVSNVAEEVVFSVIRPFGTEAPTNAFELLDHRGWEMVSPIDKGGGAVQPPGAIAGGGVFQAAAGGGAITYSSLDAFGAGAQGAPSGSQYLSSIAAGGWTTANITTPLLSGSYGDEPEGVPYQLFSPSLATALLSNGERCRGDAGGECPVANLPLPGSGAPAGYRDYYRRTSSAAFGSLLSAGDLLHTTLDASRFEMRLVAATPELDHVVFTSCAALTANATEVAAPGGCDEEDQNLYEWSGGGLALVNVLPGDSSGAPGATIGASVGAVSENGTRVYFRVGDALYLRDGGGTKLVDGSTGAEFEAASGDGAFAYILDGGNLFRYAAASETLDALTAGGEVEGVLGVSPDGSRIYYATPGGVFLAEGASTTQVAGPGAALPSDFLTAEGTARVSADGSRLLFLSDEELTGYPNEGDPEVFLYGPAGSSSASLVCVSCNPTGEAPLGGASIPGRVANGSGGTAFSAYEPRVLSTGATRAFFDSRDALVTQDTNNRQDVYEWEAGGVGTCGQAGGCIQLISTGRGVEPSIFLDASADGSDVFFLTSESIYPLDPGSYDIYDTRVGGGFTAPASPISCEADACQILPEAPEDPIPGTLTPNSGNPPPQSAGESTTKGKKKRHKKKSKAKRHPKHRAKKKRGRGGAR